MALDAGAEEFARHMALLPSPGLAKSVELSTTPIFTQAVRQTAAALGSEFTQYGLIAGRASNEEGGETSDPRLFFNTASPTSVFICGSQGSGKSHTLSCLLENCLLPSTANVLPRPLTGLVFHYDTFNSGTGGAPSEAAYLSSNDDVKVRVLCAPTNRRRIEEIYRVLPKVVVQDFAIHESQLNTKRMLDLMNSGDSLPLYMHTVTRLLRNMRLEHQGSPDQGFNYGDFKARLAEEPLISGQLSPLQQRLETLESFMPLYQAAQSRLAVGKGRKAAKSSVAKTTQTVDETWKPKAGLLTIVDLSCPCITDVMACSLFNICLSLFLEQSSDDVGRVVALDEAHKYMKDGAECTILTESLLSAIRLQRHLAVRVFISTQEPTVSPKLLDLCSVSIIHRFSSRDWLKTILSHLAGAFTLGRRTYSADGGDMTGRQTEFTTIQNGPPEDTLIEKITSLRTGEALLFAPTATVGVRMQPVLARGDDIEGESDVFSDHSSNSSSAVIHLTAPSSTIDQTLSSFQQLGTGMCEVAIRKRVTQDGGESKLSR